MFNYRIRKKIIEIDPPEPGHACINVISIDALYIIHDALFNQYLVKIIATVEMPVLGKTTSVYLVDRNGRVFNWTKMTLAGLSEETWFRGWVYGEKGSEDKMIELVCNFTLKQIDQMIGDSILVIDTQHVAKLFAEHVS